MFQIFFSKGDIQLLRYQKMPKIWNSLPPCSHMFSFGSPLPPTNVQNLTSAHPPALPPPTNWSKF